MSIPFVIQRILSAIDRPADLPLDEPTGPIYLGAADTAWLRDHLLTIATSPTPRKGPPLRSNHYLWVAVDVALRCLAMPDKPRKAALSDAADFWRVSKRNVEDWERSVRSDATRLVKTIECTVLARLVKRNRDNFLKQSR
jgi:hypothetical protein